MSWLSATAVASAITSRENSDSSMPAWPLGDAVAHGGHAARELGDAAGLAHRLLDERGEALERLMRGACRCRRRRWRCCSSPRRPTPPCRRRRRRRSRGRGCPQCAGAAAARRREPGRGSAARLQRALGDPLGDLADPGVQLLAHLDVSLAQATSSCQARPSRAISAVASTAPSCRPGRASRHALAPPPVQDRVDPAPGRGDLVLAHEQRRVAAHHVHQQPLVGVAVADGEALGVAQVQGLVLETPRVPDPCSSGKASSLVRLRAGRGGWGRGAGWPR